VSLSLPGLGVISATPVVGPRTDWATLPRITPSIRSSHYPFFPVFLRVLRAECRA
jgi:hypothetical protein